MFLKIVRALFSTAVLLWLGVYLYEQRDLLARGLTASAGDLAMLTLLILGTWLLNAVQVLIFLRLQQVQIGFWENLLLQNATQLGNYVPMRLGTILRFRYLKTIHGIEYTRLGGIALLRILLLTTAAGILGCVGTAALAQDPDHRINPLLWLLFPAMSVAPVLLWLLASRLSFPADTRAGRLAELFLSSFSALRARPAVALTLVALLLGQFLFLALRLKVSFAVVGMAPSPWILLLIAPMGILLTFLNLTPGNLGLREWAIGALSMATGYPFAEALVAGVVDRAVLMLCVFAFGSVSFTLLIRRLRSAAD